MPSVVCIAGPTGTGKTAAAIALAKRLDGVVVNMDSRQVYHDFPIITAQPDADERQACPHTLYGFLGTRTPCTAGLWIARARPLLDRGVPLVFVGGTGMYMRAIFDGIADIPPVPPSVVTALERRFEAEGDALHGELAGIDPEYAGKIHPHDKQRITRALSVWQVTGRTFTSWHKETPSPVPYPVHRYALGLSLSELEPRLEKRIDDMIAKGAVEEAERAMAVCDDASAPGWSGIGCAELHAHLVGRYAFAEAKARWLRNTRAYAKRQLTWFKADRRIRWYRPEHIDGLIEQAVTDIVNTQR